jgi:hypothetical protein
MVGPKDAAVVGIPYVERLRLAMPGRIKADILADLALAHDGFTTEMPGVRNQPEQDDRRPERDVHGRTECLIRHSASGGEVPGFIRPWRLTFVFLGSTAPKFST